MHTKSSGKAAQTKAATINPAVNVFKRRFAFTINGCITEIAQLLINGAAIQTVAVELEDIDAILKAKEILGLNEHENVNYLLAIKRVIGMEPLPD